MNKANMNANVRPSSRAPPCLGERRFLNADIWAVVNKDRKSPAQTRAINSDTITHLEKMGLFEFVKAA